MKWEGLELEIMEGGYQEAGGDSKGGVIMLGGWARKARRLRVGLVVVVDEDKVNELGRVWCWVVDGEGKGGWGGG